MTRAKWILVIGSVLLVLLGTACEPSEQPPGRRLSESAPLVPADFVLPTPKEAATATATATATAIAADAATWAALTDLNYLLGGPWSSERVRITFTREKAGSKTPYNLRFDLANDDGGCGFYDELHGEGWRTAFCRGTNLGNTTHRTRLWLSRPADPNRLKVVIDHFLDDELRSGPRR